jgi:hypothetical protein
LDLSLGVDGAASVQKRANYASACDGWGGTRHIVLRIIHRRRDNMHPRDLEGEHRIYARVAFAVVALLIIGLAGCASELTPRPSRPSAAPYVGVFTGELVDGKPLYRFPTIEVVGSRSAIGPGT